MDFCQWTYQQCHPHSLERKRYLIEKKKVQMAGPVPTRLMFFSKDKWVLHLECNLRVLLWIPMHHLISTSSYYQFFPSSSLPITFLQQPQAKGNSTIGPHSPKKRVSGKHAARQLAEALKFRYREKGGDYCHNGLKPGCKVSPFFLMIIDCTIFISEGFHFF